MNTEHRFDWRLGIGLTVGALLGFAWGVLLGFFQVRVNVAFAGWLAGGIGVPVTFLGSFSIGWVFQRVAPEWHKVARLLCALIAVALGLPAGIALGLVTQHWDAAQVFGVTGALVWNCEWLAAVLGLGAGMWSAWTQPFTRALARRLARPRAFAQKLGAGARRPVAAGLDFFQAFGRALAWLPTQVYQRWQRAPRDVPAVPRVKFQAPHGTPRAAKANAGAPRITRVVEDRCPYCLDVITRKDPRGIHTCAVCGTPHHADCWAITGKCQVPHLNV